jgi:transposase
MYIDYTRTTWCNGDMAIIDGRMLEHNTREHIRIQAVRRGVEDGASSRTVMRSFGLCRTTIYSWLRDFKKQGRAALAESISEGPAPKLAAAQQQRVKRWILGKDPRQYGFDFGLWTRRLVPQLISERMMVTLRLTSVGKLPARLNITPQKPLRRAYERDPQAVALWLAGTYPLLKRRAKQAGAMIFFLDAADFQSDSQLGRIYGLKGSPPVVQTIGQRQSIKVISAVNARGTFWTATYAGKRNGEALVLFLKNFTDSRRGRIFLVVDGYPAHRASGGQSYVASFEGRFEFHRLPTYAPDLNPDEFVWNHMKRNGVSKIPLKQNESLCQRVEADLVKIQDNRPLVQPFFGAKTVAYAAD